jgi:hypothetical protein
MSEVDFKFCRSADNVADVFTDAVARVQHCLGMGVVLGCWSEGV